MHKGWDVFTKYFPNDSLERCRHSFQPEHHNHRDEYTLFRYQFHLFLIIGMHTDLVISAEAVQEVVHLMPCYGVQHVVRKWQGKHVCDCDDVKLSIIDAYPYISRFS